MATECTQESVLDFLLENGGRVKNKDLIDHFKVFLSSENTKRTLLKERFKRFVDNIAYVKQENGEKVVCLKKKYRYPEMRRAQGEDRDDDGGGGGGDEAQNRSRRVAENRDTTGIKRGINSLQLEENGVKPACDTSQWIKGEINGKYQTSEMLIDGKSEAVNNEKKMFVPESETHNAEVCLTDIALIEKNNSEISNVRENMLQDTRNVSEHDIQSNVFELDQTVHAAELSNVHSAGKLESRASEVELDAGVGKSSLTSQIISRRRTSRGSQRSLLASSEDGSNEGLFDLLNSDGSTPKGSRKNFIELMMSSSPQVRRTLVHRNSQGNMSARNRDSLRSESDSNIILSSMDEDCASVTLDPLEHEWMICAADGQWESLQRLLTCEPSLISKKDFVTGFTCLHWAAKQGKHELFAMLVNFAKQHNVPININARSSAGYTPLHLAAMHNHIEVMKLLVGAYDADVDMRDYSGKKASQYLSATVTGDIKDIIGACGSSDTENAETGAGRWRLPKVLPSNLNPLRLLNHPEETAADGQVKPRSLYRKSSIGRIKLQRNRFKTQIVHSTSFRENDEGDNSLKSPVKSRPVSNLFG